jgi:putative membrane protein
MNTKPDEELKIGDKLAVDRTAMAADRTLMAWTRTSISMISFGFTMYKVLEGVLKEGGGIAFTKNPAGPRILGLFLIGVGTASLVIGMIEHWNTKRELGKESRFRLLSPTFLTSATILLFGAVLFLSIILKMELF